MAEVMTPNAPIEYYSRGLREKLRLDALKLNPPAIGPDQVYADIEYKLDENKYDAWSQARVRAGGLETNLPIGWPKALDGPLVWTGADLEDEGQYVLRLGDAEKAELVAALRHYKGSEPAPPTGTIDTDIRLEQGLDGHQVSRENFPLENLGSRLDTASDDIYKGKGFLICAVLALILSLPRTSPSSILESRVLLPKREASKTSAVQC